MAEVPAVAVQVVREALAVRGYLTTIDSVEAPRVAAALAREGWLHDPERVAQLEKFAKAVRASGAEDEHVATATVVARVTWALAALDAASALD